jgi:hypothetical protein
MVFAVPAASAQLYAEQKSESVYVRSIIFRASELNLSKAEEEQIHGRYR